MKRFVVITTILLSLLAINCEESKEEAASDLDTIVGIDLGTTYRLTYFIFSFVFIFKITVFCQILCKFFKILLG